MPTVTDLRHNRHTRRAAASRARRGIREPEPPIVDSSDTATWDGPRVMVRTYRLVGRDGTANCPVGLDLSAEVVYVD